MKTILFLEPLFKEMIWGGDKLHRDFGYDIPSNHTGECWAIAAHKNGDSKVLSPEFKGCTLSELWDTHRELFGNLSGEVFPLLIKIIDANDDLSIQVHPDDCYAKENENGSLGKTECWYILDCEEDTDIIIGHNAKNKDELIRMAEHREWDTLLRKVKIKKGDFFQIDAGCIHAIRGGTVILETQQNSDITYRLYDYDRLSDGKPRELHTKKALDVIDAPFTPSGIARTTSEENGLCRETLVKTKNYTVERITLSGEGIINQNHHFMNLSVIEGEGEIDGYKIKKGSHFILPFGYKDAKLSGNMELIISYL